MYMEVVRRSIIRENNDVSVRVAITIGCFVTIKIH
jgi:hypothetical protein